MLPDDLPHCLIRKALFVITDRLRNVYACQYRALSGRALRSTFDAEPGIERELSLPAARSFQLAGWASAQPSGADPELDRLAGIPSGWRLTPIWSG